MAMATPIMTEFKTNTYAGIEMKGMQRMVVIGAAGSVRAQSTCELGGLFPVMQVQRSEEVPVLDPCQMDWSQRPELLTSKRGWAA